MTRTIEPTSPATVVDYSAEPRSRIALLDRVMRFFFAPSSPGALGFSRLLLFALMIWFYITSDYGKWGALPASMQNRSLPAFRMLGITVASHDTLLIWQFVWKISLVTCCIGLFTRASLWAAFVCSFYLF